MKNLFIISALLFSFSSFSKTLDHFNQRFEFVRKDGKLVTVRDNSIFQSFGIRPYVEFIKNALIQEQEKLIQAESISETTYSESVQDLFQEEFQEALSGRNAYARKQRLDTQINNLIKSLKELGKLNITKIFDNQKFNEVISKFEFKLQSALAQLDPRVVAKPDSNNFFAIKNRTYEAVKFALNLAKKQLGEIPLLNTASYVIVEIEKMIRTQREYHQNMLLHYLQNFTPEELGLSRTEADHIFSSVYESRIAWYAFWETRAAAANWDNFGFNKFGQAIKYGNDRLLSYKGKYDKSGLKMNYSFAEATKDGEDVIVNLVDFESMIQREPAVAFSRTNPNKIKRKRMLLQLGQLGLSFVPLSQWIKGIAEDFMKSMYEQQQITEGALYGYFESNELLEDKEQLQKQYLNPFENL